MQNNDRNVVANARNLLLRGAKEVWPNAGEDQFKVAVFTSCVNHGLVPGKGEYQVKLVPVPLATIKAELDKAEILEGKAWPAAVAKHTTTFRIMDKGNNAGPAVLPWLHDVLVYPHPDVVNLLNAMPTLRQPAPPPGIPAGIPPMRKADAGAPITCKHFAAGHCEKGDQCEFAHEQPKLANIAGRAITRTGPRVTPPVDEARKVLLAALHDAWPDEEYMDIFARTAAKICIQQGFVLGKNEPYNQTVVHAPNMGTHLHKQGCGMVRGTLQQMLVREEVQPYFKLQVFPKNTPPNILCLLANVFHGHPSDLVNDIVEQTYLVEPGVEKPYILPPSNDPRPSLVAKDGQSQQTDSDSAAEASEPSHSAAPAEPAAAPARPDREHVEEPPMPAVNIAQSELVRAVALGPACQGQDSLVAVRRAVNWACLSKGFVAAQPEDASESHGPYLYKLTSVPVEAVSAHARKVMDNHGYKDRSVAALLQSENFRKLFAYGVANDGVPHVRPMLDRLIPAPSRMVGRILQQTKFISIPVAAAGATVSAAPRAWPVPEVAQSSSDSVPDAIHAASKTPLVHKRLDQSAAAAPMQSTAAEERQDAPRPETSFADPVLNQSGTDTQSKVIASAGDCKDALRHILQCKWVAVGCEGQNVSRTGRLCLVQVYAAPFCFIFDLVHPASRNILVQGLKQVLESQSIIKVMHACHDAAAALRYQLGIRVAHVFDTQLAQGLLDHIDILTGGGSEVSDPFIDLEDLLKLYGLSLPDCREFVKLQDKHWIKRPLHNNIIEYVVAGVDPLCRLGVQMMTKSGDTLTAAAIRFSYLNVESTYDDNDMEHSDLFYRKDAIWAIGQHWKPALEPSEYDAMVAQAQDGESEDEDAPSADDAIKAHHAKQSAAAESSGGTLSKHPDNVKPESLLSTAGKVAYSKVVGSSSASPGKALLPERTNNENIEHN